MPQEFEKELSHHKIIEASSTPEGHWQHDQKLVKQGRDAQHYSGTSYAPEHKYSADQLQQISDAASGSIRPYGPSSPSIEHAHREMMNRNDFEGVHSLEASQGNPVAVKLREFDNK